MPEVGWIPRTIAWTITLLSDLNGSIMWTCEEAGKKNLFPASSYSPSASAPRKQKK